MGPPRGNWKDIMTTCTSRRNFPFSDLRNHIKIALLPWLQLLLLSDSGPTNYLLEVSLHGGDKPCRQPNLPTLDAAWFWRYLAGKGAVWWRKVRFTKCVTDTVLGREASPSIECGHYEAKHAGLIPTFWCWWRRAVAPPETSCWWWLQRTCLDNSWRTASATRASSRQTRHHRPPGCYCPVRTKTQRLL